MMVVTRNRTQEKYLYSGTVVVCSLVWAANLPTYLQPDVALQIQYVVAPP